MVTERLPDPSEPEAVGRAEFPTSFRGFDQMQVRAYLKVVAHELQRLRDRETELTENVAALRKQLAERALDPAELDEAVLTARLGEETGRVLEAARSAAAERVRRAEVRADEIIGAAQAEAEQIRGGAQAAFEAEVSEGRERGRELVAEARLVRERILDDLARRRRTIRIQVEQLRAGRDRLVQSNEVLRRALDDIERELESSLPEARGSAERVGRRMQTEPVATAAELESEIESARMAGIPIVAREDIDAALAEEEPVEEWINEGVPPAVETDVADTRARTTPVDEPTDEIPVLDHFGDGDEILLAELGMKRTSHPDLPREPVPIVGAPDAVEEVRVVGQHTPVEGETEPSELGAETATGSVDDLFARIRESRAETVARAKEVLEQPIEPAPAPVVEAASNGTGDSSGEDDAGVVEEPVLEGDAALIAERDRVLAKVETQIIRKLKRLLSDEQNEIQDLVRRQRGKVRRDDVLGTREHHVGRYVAAVGGELLAAVAAGASFYDPHGDAGDVDLAPLDERLATELIDPLRQLLGRGIDGASGDEDDLLDSVRAAYRELKAQRAEGAARDVCLAAFSIGVVAAAKPGTLLRWAVDPAKGCSPDCDDNALAGGVEPNEAFPTGALYPPGYAGCRCLLIPADQ